MPDQPAPLLVLTVGTGTAGRTSNLVAGLRAAIAQTAPARFWLVPSTDEMSRLIADEVAAGQAAFAPWSDTEPYAALAAPDDLEACRRHLRTVIEMVSGQIAPRQNLLLNPTSGTKQMTAAAVLAALDAGQGEIVFIAGERADGVVVTGTERLVRFDAASYFQERDLAQARAAYALGAYAAAERLLAPHRTALVRAHAIAACVAAWRRQDYRTAASHAARFDDQLRSHLKKLADDTEQRNPEPPILSDLLSWADLAVRRGDADTALILAYKSLELGARHALQKLTGLLPPYPIEKLKDWPLNHEDFQRIQRGSRSGEAQLGLQQVMSVLAAFGDPMGQSYRDDPRYRRAAEARNELTHEIQPAQVSEAQQFHDLTRNLLQEHLNLPPAPALPKL